MAQQPVNPDQVLVQRFARDAAMPVPVTTNPVATDLGTTLQAWDTERRMLTLGFAPHRRHLQGNGAVHGGVVATMLDFGLAFAVMAESPNVAVTAALNVQYERAVPAEPLEVRATVHRAGGRLAFAAAELAARGTTNILARATATLAVLG